MDEGGNWLWAVKAKVTDDEMQFGLALDEEGNAYLAGTFEGTTSFGSHTLTSSGDMDIYVAKLDADGSWLWAVKAGGLGRDRGYCITVDGAGNVYVTGEYSGTASFGDHTLTSSGCDDIFVAKLGAAGNWLWAVKAGGPSDDKGYCITLDGAGNVCVTGEFADIATFGDHTLTSSGGDDIFVAKLNPDGSWLWAAKALGTTGLDVASIAADSSGNTYVTGTFLDTVNFGNHTLTTNNNDEVFVAKLDADGNWLWAAQAGGELHNRGFDIVLDDAGNAYTTGFYCAPATFGDHTLTGCADENLDIFVAKLNADGNWLWAVPAGGPGVDAGLGVALDGAGNVYVTGGVGSTATFGDHTLTAGGMLAIFVAKLGSGTPVDDDLAPQIASRLHDAWPNPFSRGSNTMIKADIPERSMGTLSIYNLRGQKVARYELSSGSHEINFTGENLPAGVYLYSLQCGTFKETKKLVLLK